MCGSRTWIFLGILHLHWHNLCLSDNESGQQGNQGNQGHSLLQLHLPCVHLLWVYLRMKVLQRFLYDFNISGRSVYKKNITNKIKISNNCIPLQAASIARITSMNVVNFNEAFTISSCVVVLRWGNEICSLKILRENFEYNSA